MSEFTDQGLRISIQRDGVFLPAYTYRGTLVDGSRRIVAAQAVGVACPSVELGSVESVVRMLWGVGHRARAYARVAPMSVTEFAALLGVRVAAVAPVVAATRPKEPAGPRARKARVRTEPGQPALMQFWALPVFRAAVERATARHGSSVSEFCRAALWRYVRECVDPDELAELVRDFADISDDQDAPLLREFRRLHRRG